MYDLRDSLYWDFALGPVFGLAGTITTITISPQSSAFRVERVKAVDSGNPPGTATMVQSFFVGPRAQRPTLAGATLAVFFGTGVESDLLRWDICDRGSNIALTIQFVQDATFNGALFGSAIK